MKTLEIGTPIKPMLVSEIGASEDRFQDIMKRHKGESLVETKYDGYRVQVHKNSAVQLFTRNLNPLPVEVFPELADSLSDLPNGIYDGELAGVQGGITGFNAVKKRVKSRLDPALVEEFPLEIRYFDILQVETTPLIELSLTERRRELEQRVENVSTQELITDPEELKRLFLEVTEQGLEGVVCKNPNSDYRPGTRTKEWLKLKKFLSLDLAVLGVYQGQGKATDQPFAALLLGTRNGDQYETITKVGISTKETIEAIREKVEDHYSNSPPRGITLSPALAKQSYASKVPTHYIDPEHTVVVEVEAMNITRSKNWHSCGLTDKAYSTRIPVVRGIRNDKTPREATTTKQVSELYVE